MVRQLIALCLSCWTMSGCMPIAETDHDEDKGSLHNAKQDAYRDAYQDTHEKSGLIQSLSSVTLGQKIETGQTIQLPKDHGPHNNYAIEWWYFTAILEDENNNLFPFQWTLFRMLQPPHEQQSEHQQMFMAHSKLASKNQNWFEERFARPELLNVGVGDSDNQGKFEAYLDDWHWQAKSADLFPAQLNVTLQHKVIVSLSLTGEPNYVLQGNDGLSIKLADGSHASMYYSHPHIQVNGTIQLPSQTINVTGLGWFDHEWSSNLVSAQTLGWDWFSIHMENGTKLMLFSMRNQQQVEFWSGSLIDVQGQKHILSNDDIKAHASQFSSVRGKSLPLHWNIQVPKFDLNLNVSPFKTDQWNSGSFAYYEGAIFVTGSHKGQGFLELTGY